MAAIVAQSAPTPQPATGEPASTDQTGPDNDPPPAYGLTPDEILNALRQSEEPSNEEATDLKQLEPLGGEESTPITAEAARPEPESEGENACPICYDDMEEGTGQSTLDCNHKFHAKCIYDYLHSFKVSHVVSFSSTGSCV